jgi:hypothetical protein
VVARGPNASRSSAAVASTPTTAVRMIREAFEVVGGCGMRGIRDVVRRA